MAKKRSPAVDLAVFVTIRLCVCVVQAVPARLAFSLADFIAWLLYRCIPSRRKIAFENLLAAYPELNRDPGQAEQIVRAMYRHLIRAVVEGLLLPRKLHVTNWRAFVDVYPAVGMSSALLSSRSVLIATGHFGNWEMAGYLLGCFGFKTFAIARVLDNPYLERFVLRIRQATGQTIIFKNDDFDRLTLVLSNGGKVSTLADQDAGQRGVFVNFFGRPASTHKAIALMAMEFDALVMVVGVPRVPREGRAASRPPAGMEATYYAIEVEEVIDPREFRDRPDAVNAITQRYTSALERVIRRHPEQYFWLHRRWKHQPKKKEKKAPAAA
jgi:KDO2-lipid IV(A) lauroyltransferase